MQHYNTSITEDMNRILNLKGGESTTEINDVIQPVIILDPEIVLLGSGTLTNASSQNLFNTSAFKDTYITTLQFAFIKDITSTSTLMTISAIIKGVSVNIIRVPSITLTVHSGQVEMVFQPPLKIDRGTSVSLISNTNVANILTAASVFGYTREITKGV